MYYLPPEWGPQSAVMLTWPHEEATWFPSLAEVETSFVGMAKEIVKRERLLINCLNSAHLQHISTHLTDAKVDLKQVQFFIIPSNDVWARDHGPLTVFNHEGASKLLDFKFNGWGNKYPADRDDCITRQMHKQNAFAPKVLLESVDCVLEGGSIEVDGQGTLLTTRSCLTARNAHANADVLEQYLKNWFGVNRVLWLDHGYLAGDDTDGHIDTLARFTDPQTIAYVRCDDPLDEHYSEFMAMEAQLQSFKNYLEQPYRLIPLPWPAPKYGPDKRRLPATYANFLIINNAVLVPTYDDAADAQALRQLGICFPDREVVGIPCRHLIEQYGSLHCVTMQLPAGILNS